MNDEYDKAMRDCFAIDVATAKETLPAPTNSREAECFNALIENGWWVDRRGWPDFLCRAMTETWQPIVFCVEVKRNGDDEPREEQLSIMQTLELAGVPCFLWDRYQGFRRMGSHCFDKEYGRQPNDKECADPLTLRCLSCRGDGKAWSITDGITKTLQCEHCGGSGLATPRLAEVKE